VIVANSNETTQAEINGVLWRACDTFRGVVDPSEYKNYILVMLFLKYISDIWKDHYEKYSKQFKGEKTRIARKMANERFTLPEGASFDDLYERRDEPNLGELINIALEHIEESPANKAKLDGVFRNVDFNSDGNLGRPKERNERLKNLLHDFRNLDLRPSKVSEDVIGNAYIYLIERFASGAGKKAGEFFTPAQVSKLIAKLAMPKSGDRICDPACGSGSLLVKVAAEIADDNYSLYGQEVNGSTWALARMNMFLHSKDAARIDWCDTLSGPTLVEADKLMRFNVVVANPPFSLDKWGADKAEDDRFKRFHRGVPPKTKGDFAFITHMVEIALPKEGRIAVVVPHGVLFRSSSEGRIRQKLIEENLLDAVIGLPANLFPSTSIPVAVLVFDRSREKGGANEKRQDVLFIDASREFQSGKNQNTLLDEQVDRIVETYQRRKNVAKYAHGAKLKEIKDNDFNLNIPRYVDTFEAEAEIDIGAVQAEIEQLEGDLAKVRKKMAGYLKELGVMG
jgi:type I restriction enzyme M protein